MSENLDVMIAFVVIIIGLSTTLQLLMNFVKNQLHLRWRVYESVLKDLYTTFLGAGRDEMKDLRHAPVPIQSVTHRMRTFHDKLTVLWEAVQEVRDKLKTTQAELAARPDVPEKIHYLQAEISHDLPQVEVLVQRIRGLGIEDLLALYLQIRKTASQDDPVFFEVKTYLDRLSQVLDDFEKAVRDGSGEVLAGVEGTLAEILNHFTALEKRIGGLCAMVGANLEDSLRLLEQRYANQVQKWCFLVGVLLCGLFNADAVTMYKALRESPVLTQSIAEHQEEITAGLSPPSRTPTLNELSDLAGKVQSELDRGTASGFGDFQTSFNTLADLLSDDADALRAARGFEGDVRFDSEKAKQPVQEARKALDAEDLKKASRLVESGMGRISSGYLTLETAKIRLRTGYLLNAGLPLGWGGGRWDVLWWDAKAIALKLLGLLLTSILISFGAPLWNDVLEALLGVKGMLRRTPQESPKP